MEFGHFTIALSDDGQVCLRNVKKMREFFVSKQEFDEFLAYLSKPGGPFTMEVYDLCGSLCVVRSTFLEVDYIGLFKMHASPNWRPLPDYRHGLNFPSQMLMEALPNIIRFAMVDNYEANTA